MHLAYGDNKSVSTLARIEPGTFNAELSPLTVRLGCVIRCYIIIIFTKKSFGQSYKTLNLHLIFFKTFTILWVRFYCCCCLQGQSSVFVSVAPFLFGLEKSNKKCQQLPTFALGFRHTHTRIFTPLWLNFIGEWLRRQKARPFVKILQNNILELAHWVLTLTLTDLFHYGSSLATSVNDLSTKKLDRSLKCCKITY